MARRSLAATPMDGKRPLLCGNVEGWGPWSLYRPDFTPCFLEACIAAVAVALGIGMGLGVVYHLRRQRLAAPVVTTWHFHTMRVTLAILGLTVTLQTGLEIRALPRFWLSDLRVWTPVLTLLSLGVMGAVQYLEHRRSRQFNRMVLVYWLLMALLYSVKLRSLVSQKIMATRPFYAATFAVTTSFMVLQLMLGCAVPTPKSMYRTITEDGMECPIEHANVFSLLTFGWMTPLMKYGYSSSLTQDDLWSLRKCDSSEFCAAKMRTSWDIQMTRKRPSLWISMFQAFGGPYLYGGILKITSDALQYAQPQLLRLLIVWVESYRTTEPQSVMKGVCIALAMFVASISQTCLLHQSLQITVETGIRIKAALTTMIYDKTMRLSNESRATKSTGEIVNYMAVDTQRLEDLSKFGYQLCSTPVQIALCMISLYDLMGASIFVGVLVMISSILLNGVIAKVQKNLQQQQMRHKDTRIFLMTEILNNIKSIKLFTWSQVFMKKLSFIRNDQELHTLRKIGSVAAAQDFTLSGAPMLVCAATFSVYALISSRPFSVDLIFPAIALFNLLTFPMMELPSVIATIIEATVAGERLTSFFMAKELQSDAVIIKEAARKAGDEAIRVSDASFTWDCYTGQKCLQKIEFVARKGELSCIVGRVGSGKTSLLESILGNVWKLSGEITLHGSVAYAAQQAWIMNTSVRENILFGRRWDPEFYEQTVMACALKQDFNALPDGDQTEVGDRGISLSGGQKARLALARAVYARADVYVFDDVLSAVDQHVGRHIIAHVLGPGGLLASRARVLATNELSVLKEADCIALIQNGTMIEKGTNRTTAQTRAKAIDLIESPSTEIESSTSSGATSSIHSRSGPAEEESVLLSDKEREKIQKSPEGNNNLALIQTGERHRARKHSTSALDRASTLAFMESHRRLPDDERGDPRPKQRTEIVQKGKVKWDVYREYAKANSLVAVSAYLLALMGAQTLSVGANLWLKSCAETSDDSGGNRQAINMIGIYFALGLGGSFCMGLQTLIMWIYCSIQVGTTSEQAR